MAFGSFAAGRNAAPVAEINVIPLVDIMLVLLVIFIVTAPLLTHAVKIDLPQAANVPNDSKAASIELALDAEGRMFWDGEPIDRSRLLERFASAGQREPAPELHLRVDRATRYETLAELMSEAGRSGLTKVGFVTDPSSQAAR
ncbi:ExbD/TolR family protein [Steroidobacter sp.]|uniref:ExbD/TolR family protein n=1 Tax=Steroidobacter sp. TaxID=1978227 RepID=UPI001A5AACAF|nr:biopolymer transporter ExbD [Steroidobacter sp.]MBL8269290.1 biopolymer transporter ExbD [Steroidobacter sp.]